MPVASWSSIALARADSLIRPWLTRKWPRYSSGRVEAVETIWGGHLTLPPATLGDTLLLADQLVAVRSPLDPLREEDGHERAILDLVFNDVLLSNMLKEAAGDVESLAAILRG